MIINENKILNNEIFIDDKNLKNKLKLVFNNMSNYNNHNFKRLNNIIIASENKLNILTKINHEIKSNEIKISNLSIRRKNLKSKLRDKQKEFGISLNDRNLDA